MELLIKNNIRPINDDIFLIFMNSMEGFKKKIKGKEYNSGLYKKYIEEDKKEVNKFKLIDDKKIKKKNILINLNINLNSL